MKAIILVTDADADTANDIALLIAATLSLNGYQHNAPAVVDWPIRAAESPAP